MSYRLDKKYFVKRKIMLDKGIDIDYILAETVKKIVNNSENRYYFRKALEEKKKVKVELNFTYGNFTQGIFLIQEGRDLWRKLVVK